MEWKSAAKCNRNVEPELPILANGHHDEQVSQDAHEHDQWQEADESNPLRHAVAVETKEW